MTSLLIWAISVLIALRVPTRECSYSLRQPVLVECPERSGRGDLNSCGAQSMLPRPAGLLTLTGRYVALSTPEPNVLDATSSSSTWPVVSSKRRMPRPTRTGKIQRERSSSSPSRSSHRTSVGLPGTWMFLPGCSLSFVSSSARSPVTRRELAHLRGVARVEDTTYLGAWFRKSAIVTSLPCLGQ